VQLFIVAGLIFSVSTLRVRRKHLRRLVYTFVGISILVSAYAIYQTFARTYDLPFGYLTIYNPSLAPEKGAMTRGGMIGSYVRPSSFFTEPSRLGLFLLTPTLICFYLYISATKRWMRKILLVALILTGFAFILSFSIGAYIAMGAAVLFGFFIRGWRKYSLRLILVVVGLGLILSFLLLPVLGYSFLEMIWIRGVAQFQVFGVEAYSQSQFAVSSAFDRLVRAKQAFQVWWDHPLLGVGLNNFGRFYAPGIPALVHSAFLQSLAEMGILGGVSFLSLLAFPSSALLRRRGVLFGWEKSLCVALGASLVGRLAWMILAGTYQLDFFWVDLMFASLLLSRTSSTRKGMS